MEKHSQQVEINHDSAVDAQAQAKKRVTRRRILQAGAFAVMGGILAKNPLKRLARAYNPYAQTARVSVLHASSYDKNLSELLRQGIKNHQLDVRGKSVVLKPNLVEFHADRCINTNPLIVAAAIDAFRGLGAAEVIVAEGPGHCRDTEMLCELSGLDEVVKSEKVKFVDLNLDTARAVKLPHNLTKLGELWLPETILKADLVVSMPKMKIHHWAGATLSLKNLFGVVPSAYYGWPKNVLHWHGIDESIIDIASAVRPGFTIIDGIVGMEGNGPLHGDAINSQVIVMSENLVAADATAARLMGLNPRQIRYLDYAEQFGAPLADRLIEQRGERLQDYRREFKLMERQQYLRA